MNPREAVWVALSILLGMAGGMIWFLISPGLIEAGDGVMHYQIAKWSWVHPELFLEHWGKPLFTILSSPFAQIGYVGMVVFNCLCFAFAGAIIHQIAHFLGLKWSWIGVILVFCAPEYARMVMAGMTEILFSTVYLAVILSFVNDRYRLGAFIFGLSLFVRPESQVIAVPVLLYLLLKDWKAIPFLGIGLLIFSLAGYFVLGDYLWYFNSDPYSWENNLYGSGSFWVFIDAAKNISGIPIALFFFISVFVIPRKWMRSKEESDRTIWWLLLVFGAMAAVWFTHSYLWWKGSMGSMGLIRVMATITPLMALVILYGLNLIFREINLSKKLKGIIALAMASISIIVLVDRLKIPKHKDPSNLCVESVVSQINIPDGGICLHGADPYIPYALGLDPFDSEQWRFVYAHDGKSWKEYLNENDLVIWDSHFAPNEGGLALEDIVSDRRFQAISEDSREWKSGLDFEAHVFKVVSVDEP